MSSESSSGQPTRKKRGPTGVGNRGKGRPKGSTNKVPAALKDMILQALDGVGGVDYLMRQARKKNPAPFMALIGKTLPMTVAGDPNAPLGITVEIKNF